MGKIIGSIGAIVSRNRIIVSLLLGGALWFLSRPTLLSIAAGAPFVILGEAIRTWSSGHIRKNQELATTGPYAFTRNPLYLGSGMMGFGFILMGRSWGLLLLFLMFFALIYHFTILREEEKLSARFGSQFSAYAESVPRFFPRWSAWRQVETGFDWGLVLKHREHRTWLGIVVILALMMIRM
ncbi:methyltransferase family protein [Candidatus Manganitrophus noduliformans]|nr:isoprenylcysteine carboxylmethyltransferase family protein [Candidatus Manganitrophus noduliformans]